MEGRGARDGGAGEEHAEGGGQGVGVGSDGDEPGDVVRWRRGGMDAIVGERDGDEDGVELGGGVSRIVS